MQSKKGHQLRSTFRLAGGDGHPHSGRTSPLQPCTTSVSFPRHVLSSVLYYHICSTFCVCRAVANGKLATSKRTRNKACNLVEHHHIKSSQELCGKRSSHLGPMRTSAANSTTCRSMKLLSGTEFRNVFPLHSFFACSCLKYVWNCSMWSSFLSFYVGFQRNRTSWAWDFFALVAASVLNRLCWMLRENEERRFLLLKYCQSRISLLGDECQGTSHWAAWIQALSSCRRPGRAQAFICRYTGS